MYADIITNKKVELYNNYVIDYNFDPTWNMQSLIVPLLDIPGNSTRFCRIGDKLTLADHPSSKEYVLVLNRISSPLGVIPMKVLSDYSSRGFINWEAHYYMSKGFRYVWFELK